MNMLDILIPFSWLLRATIFMFHIWINWQRKKKIKRMWTAIAKQHICLRFYIIFSWKFIINWWSFSEGFFYENNRHFISEYILCYTILRNLESVYIFRNQSHFSSNFVIYLLKTYYRVLKKMVVHFEKNLLVAQRYPTMRTFY